MPTNVLATKAEADGKVDLYLGERRLWRYHHTPVAGGQPCFHPVNTPAGYTISLLSPWDHVHHCGLWFAWKLIDGLNAWEGPAYPPYTPRIIPELLDPANVGFRAAYRWQGGDGRSLLHGEVECRCSLLADDVYAIDMAYEFAAPGDRPVLLDRNPPPTAGYAGLSIRLIREFRHASYRDADGRTQPPPRGTRTAWHSYYGPIDGGPNRRGGVALLDHPGNPRFPSPTYCIHESESFGFLQYAFLYDEPYTLVPGELLRLRYRVVVYDGDIGSERTQAAFEDYARKVF